MKLRSILFVTVFCLLVAVGIVSAHGVTINLEVSAMTGEITITAAYDAGEPMAEAQVAIFAPDDLANPWKTGTADVNGVYTFLPDYTKVGTWEIQVRLAGHGNTNYIYLDESMAPSDAAAAGEAESAVPMDVQTDGSVVIQGDATIIVQGQTSIVVEGEVRTAGTTTSTGFSGGQILIMAVSVIWGFVGTALFFARRRTEPKQKSG